MLTPVSFKNSINNTKNFHQNTVKPKVLGVLKDVRETGDTFVKNNKVKKALTIAGIGLSIAGGLYLIYKALVRKIESDFAHIKRKAADFDIEEDKDFENKAEGLSNITLNIKGKKLSVWDINPYDSDKYAVCCLGFGCPKDHPDAVKSYEKLIDEGYGVVTFDYLGWGESSGDKLSEKGTNESVNAVFNYLHKKGIEDKDISLIGHSLGCGVAAGYAKNHKVEKLVLINPFNKLNEAMKGEIDAIKAPKVVKAAVKKAPGSMIPLKNKFNNEKAIKKVENPTLIIHSADDKTIPVELAHKLYHKAQHNPNVNYVEFENGGHLLSEEKIDAVLNFLSA